MLRRCIIAVMLVVFSNCAKAFSYSGVQQNQVMELIMASALYPKLPRFAYASNNSTNNVSMYMIDYSTGMLIAMGSMSAGTGPSFVRVDPAGNSCTLQIILRTM